MDRRIGIDRLGYRRRRNLTFLSVEGDYGGSYEGVKARLPKLSSPRFDQNYYGLNDKYINVR